MAKDLLIEARDALSTGAWEKARELLESARNAEESAEICEELAWACWWLNDIPPVFEYRSRAYKLYLEDHNPIGASRCASWTGLDYIEFKGEFAVASGWFNRAENLLEGLPPSQELSLIKLLKARWAFEAEKNTKAALILIDESLALSKSAKSIEGEMMAEALKGFILVKEGNIAEGMPLLDEATLLALTSDQSDAKISTLTCCYLIDACERIRDFERAGQWCNTVREICLRWRYKAMFASCRMKYAGVLIWQGEWVKAEKELQQGFKELREFRPLQVDAARVRLADLKRRQGNWKEAEKLFNEVGSHPLKQLYAAAFHYDKGEFTEAENMAERYLRRIPMHEKAERTAGVELLIKIYLELNSKDKANILLNELREIAEAIQTEPLHAALWNAEGHFHFFGDNFDQASRYLEDAVDLYERLELPYESSKTRLTLAKAQLNLKQYARVEKELKKAIEELKRLGAKKDLDKANYLLKNLYNEKAVNTNKNISGFTGREIEVLQLLTQGRNNEEIAEKLYLSVRTVEKHLANIYSKLGVTGKSARAYAVSYAMKNNLIF